MYVRLNIKLSLLRFKLQIIESNFELPSLRINWNEQKRRNQKIKYLSRFSFKQIKQKTQLYEYFSFSSGSQKFMNGYTTIQLLLGMLREIKEE